MAVYKIKEGTNSNYLFFIDDVLVLDNTRNDLTVDYTNEPLGYCHFKTSEGANIFKKQEILATDVVVEAVGGGQENPTTPEELRDALTNINYFEWIFGTGGGGGVDRFDELDDTFVYTGKQGHVPVVNVSETGLISTFLFNFSRLAQLLDVSIPNPLLPTDMGKVLKQQLISGQQKITLVDDTSNTPIPPNQVISATIGIVDDELTVGAGALWRIDGILYSNALDYVETIPYATTGNQRYDIIIAKNDGTLDRVEGVEGTGDIAEPVLPANTLRVTKLLVTDDSITENPYPFGDPWISKESKGTITVFATGIINNLEHSNLTVYDFTQSAEVRGILTASTAPANDPNYVNQKYTFRNSSGSNVTFKHLHASGQIKFFMPNETDFVLTDGYTCEFIYNKVTNTLDYIGNFTSGGGGVSLPFPAGERQRLGKGWSIKVGDAMATVNEGAGDEPGDMFYWFHSASLFGLALMWLGNDIDDIEDFEPIAQYEPSIVDQNSL